MTNISTNINKTNNYLSS